MKTTSSELKHIFKRFVSYHAHTAGCSKTSSNCTLNLFVCICGGIIIQPPLILHRHGSVVHKSNIRFCRFSPVCNWLITVDDARRIVLWDFVAQKMKWYGFFCHIFSEPVLVVHTRYFHRFSTCFVYRFWHLIWGRFRWPSKRKNLLYHCSDLMRTSR
jgi:hypothetical protein